MDATWGGKRPLTATPRALHLRLPRRRGTSRCSPPRVIVRCQPPPPSTGGHLLEDHPSRPRRRLHLPLLRQRREADRRLGRLPGRHPITRLSPLVEPDGRRAHKVGPEAGPGPRQRPHPRQRGPATPWGGMPLPPPPFPHGDPISEVASSFSRPAGPGPRPGLAHLPGRGPGTAGGAIGLHPAGGSRAGRRRCTIPLGSGPASPPARDPQNGLAGVA